MLVSSNPVMREARAQCSRVAPTDASVLILGETGVGKELLARALHEESGRAGRFVALNCGAVPETLIEAELFGHEAGAFTGATGSKEGLFRAASQGTLFLDEVGDLPQAAQVSTLRALQERRIRPVGSSDEVEVNVRIVAATRWDLDAEVEAQRFRADLLYRLDVIRVVIPPLRERPEDVPALVEAFLTGHRRRGLPRKTIHAEAVQALASYPFPGNVRELRNVVERCQILSTGDEIQLSDLPKNVLEAAGAPAPVSPGGASYDVDLPLAEVERRHILAVLEANGGNKLGSARVLGINVKTLYNKLKSYEKAGRGPQP